MYSVRAAASKEGGPRPRGRLGHGAPRACFFYIEALLLLLSPRRKLLHNAFVLRLSNPIASTAFARLLRSKVVLALAGGWAMARLARGCIAVAAVPSSLIEFS